MNCDTNLCKAGCCGPVPITKDIMKKHKDKISKKSTIMPMGNIALIFNIKTLTCGFLDSNLKCKIYNDRPEVCRTFGDGKQKHPLLKCKFLGQIGSQEQELYSDRSIKRLETKNE